MKLKNGLFFLILLSSMPSLAGFGISAGSGIPFLGQVGLDYKTSEKLSFYLGYNILDLSIDSASVKLTMPEALVRYHPFSGSFFIGAGLGQETLEATATDATTGLTVVGEVEAMTGIAKLGWMWGASDNSGFWFGVDVAYIMPFNAETTITAPGVPTTDQDYIDVVEAADKFGETAYLNITFARLGFLF